MKYVSGNDGMTDFYYPFAASEKDLPVRCLRRGRAIKLTQVLLY